MVFVIRPSSAPSARESQVTIVTSRTPEERTRFSTPAKRPPARGEVYPNHMIQVLAYCALVEEQLRECVPYGLVIYAGQQVRRVEFTDSNRRWLMHTIAALQAARLAKQAKRNHNQRGRFRWTVD